MVSMEKGNGKDQFYDECDQPQEQDTVVVYYDDGSMQEMTLEDWLWGQTDE